jgi:Na+/melibiose symporter-like transporter
MLVTLPLCGLWLVLGVPQTYAGKEAAGLDLRRSARQLWRNGPFRRLNIVMLIGYAAETFRITITLFFARDVVGLTNIGTVYVLYFIAGFCGVPFWLWLSGRIGKHRALATAFVLVALTSLLLFLVQPGQTTLFVVLFVAKGLCFGALELLPSSMFADIADVDTAMSRERRQGLVFSVSQMVNKMGQAIGQGLSLNLLALVGFNAAGGSGPDALFWLRILYCVLPALVLLTAIWLLLRYPLTAGRHARLRAALDRRAADIEDSSDKVITFA